ncbi:MAG: hypothetical protein FWF11_04500 [Coriobacteriia bacterium]|nr:hypothetical protein [Coriobacteriia bacterium]
MTLLLASALALIGAWLIPAIAMRIIMAARFKSGKQQATNYAGKTVSYGLALVWLVWTSSLALFLVLGSWLTNSKIISSANATAQLLTEVMAHYSWENTFFVLAVPLVLSCFFFGWLDDCFGRRGDGGGFKGHIKALLRGKLTTGMAKLLGIGCTALAVSIFLVGFDPFAGGFLRLSSYDLLLIVLATCAIALSANLINLFDLRPARASKVYVFLTLQVAFISLCAALVFTTITGLWNPAHLLREELVHVLWLLGPIAAIWRYDAGERAMLGDAGANPAGALLGLFAVSGLFVLLPVYVLFVLALNLASEKVSYSQLIERTPWLQRIDSWGRPL